MEIEPRLAAWSALCVTVVVYCLNMVGAAVRDLLAPRPQGGRRGASGTHRGRQSRLKLSRSR